MMSLKYSLTKEDYSNYYAYIMWDAPDKKKSHLKYYLRQLLVNGGIIVLLFYTGLFQSQQTYFYLYIGVLVLVMGVQIFSARNRVKKQAEKITEDINNSSFFNAVEIQVSETGLISKDSLKECKYSWAAFIRKQENEKVAKAKKDSPVFKLR